MAPSEPFNILLILSFKALPCAAVKKEEVLSNLTVIKRNGKKMEFKPKKIGIAIKKGFDDVIDQLL